MFPVADHGVSDARRLFACVGTWQREEPSVIGAEPMRGKASDQEQKAVGARSVKAFRQWHGAQSRPNVVGATERQGARVHLSLLLTAA